MAFESCLVALRDGGLVGVFFASFEEWSLANVGSRCDVMSNSFGCIQAGLSRRTEFVSTKLLGEVGINEFEIIEVEI